MRRSQFLGERHSRGVRHGLKVAVVLSAMTVVSLPGASVAGAATSTSASSYLGPLVGRRVAGPAAFVGYRQGRRMYSGSSTNFVESSNWSGLAMTGSGIQGAEGAWTVPSIQPSSSALYSASWVGVDGFGNSDLIQTGTSQDTSDGYSAWWEILPAPSVEITTSTGSPAPVQPGDQILASVAEASSGVWTIYIQDNTQGWYFEQNFDYSGPGQSAEWIEEAPDVNGQQSYPANFGTVPFSQTGIYGDFGSGLGWYATDMTSSNEVAMVNSAGNQILAMPSAPSAPSSNGQSFTDTYVTPPGTPRALQARAGSGSASLSWEPPVTDGGTPIASYYVDEYQSGSLLHTYSVTGTSMTISGLTDGKTYVFTVAAHSSGNWTSPFSSSVSVEPVAPPRVSVVSPTRNYQVTTNIAISYRATDVLPVGSYDVRYRVGPWNKKYYGSYVYPSSWQRTSSKTVRLTGKPGNQYCFSVRARTTNGVASRWTADDCTMIPLGSRSLSLATRGWSRHTGAGYYLNSYVETRAKGAELRLAGAEASQLALVVTKCPGCGQAIVFINGKVLAKVSTYAPKWHHKVVMVLPDFSFRKATVVIKSVDKGKLLIIEGLGVS